MSETYIRRDELPELIRQIVKGVADHADMTITATLAKGFAGMHEAMAAGFADLHADIDKVEKAADAMDDRLESIEGDIHAIRGFLQMDKERH